MAILQNIKWAVQHTKLKLPYNSNIHSVLSGDEKEDFNNE